MNFVIMSTIFLLASGAAGQEQRTEQESLALERAQIQNCFNSESKELIEAAANQRQLRNLQQLLEISLTTIQHCETRFVQDHPDLDTVFYGTGRTTFALVMVSLSNSLIHAHSVTNNSVFSQSIILREVPRVSRRNEMALHQCLFDGAVQEFSTIKERHPRAQLSSRYQVEHVEILAARRCMARSALLEGHRYSAFFLNAEFLSVTPLAAALLAAAEVFGAENLRRLR